MKKVLAILFLVVVIFAIWKVFGNKQSSVQNDKQEPIRSSAHSGVFNQSAGNLVNSYLDLSSSFVNDDSVNIKIRDQKFLTALDSLKVDELQKDSTQSIYTTVKAQSSDVKSNAQAIQQETNLSEMRKDFKMVSENLYPLLKSIGYKGQKLYLQNCPMAFGEGKDASWISNTKEIMNPYMGKHNPEFKSSMLHCGETKDTIK